MLLSKYSRNIFIILIVFVVYTIGSFSIYLERTLQGDINNHILAGEMFGTPEELEARGIDPLYHGPGNTGWDGQFYYYMSNDIFGLKDTAEHIDTPHYRYQRVGISLLVSIVSRVLFQDWVSPTTFILTYFLLISAATLTGALLIRRYGGHPALILLWSCSVGTQITLFNALPDASADAFLILALFALAHKRYVLSVIPFTFAALSREVYVLFPSFILLFILLKIILGDLTFSGKSIKRILTLDSVKEIFKNLLVFRTKYLLVIPGITAVGWLLYIIMHFGGQTPFEAAADASITGAPYAAWYEYFMSGIQGNHKHVWVGELYSYAEVGSLLFFLLTLISTFILVVYIFANKRTEIKSEVLGVSASLFTFVLIYSSLGSTVMQHYTGYIKALAIFLFLIPLLCSVVNLNKMLKYPLYALLVAGVSFTTIYNMRARILPDTYTWEQYTNMHTVTGQERIECFDKYKADVIIDSVKIQGMSLLSKLLGRKDLIVVDVTLRNTGTKTFVSTRNHGGVYMSYHWLDSDNKNVVQDGIRTALKAPLGPGQETQLSIISPLSSTNEKLILYPSPVQEGCAWFYQVNDCEECTPIESTITLSDLLPALKINERIIFNNQGNGVNYLGDGWSHSEHWGTWSSGSSANMFFPIPPQQVDSIVIEANAFVPNTIENQRLAVTINGIPTANLVLKKPDAILDIKIPEAVKQALENETLEVRFNFSDAVSPKSIGLSDDPRELALGLIAVTIR